MNAQPMVLPQGQLAVMDDPPWEGDERHRRLEDELAATRRRLADLEESDRQIHEFLATLAHELRNPLAPIRNAVSLLRLGGLSAAMIEWYSTVIDRQLAHLTRLVDDLLDVSRISSGKITIHREPVEMAPVVETAVDSSRPLIEARKHTLEILLPDEPLQVEGDPTRLSQILLNLLNNAAKYTPEGGGIRLAVAREGAQAVVRVADTGLGISAELLPRVFDLFTQGDRSLDRAEGGLGIGLALVRRLVEMHGGSVEAHSAGPGCGSEFVVRLPWLAAPPAPRDSSGERETQPLQPAGPRRVLVIDDNRDAADMMTVLLELWGHEVRIAHHGLEALDLAADYRPDAVLLDIGLPGMDGYEVAKRLRQLPGWDGVMLVAVTGYGQDEDLRRSRETGFDHHLVKPVEPLKLECLLASAR
ncbi:MAG TPA: ATP-binding protein [Thermoanaerobaculia bacterium]|jgi:signal transduction histidine kinase|nr:ATP-binding protein [Thermoanaerobaculia bacterium]